MIPFPLHIADVRLSAAKKAALRVPIVPQFGLGNIDLPTEELGTQNYIQYRIRRALPPQTNSCF
jgi:hypothetical protein